MKKLTSILIISLILGFAFNVFAGESVQNKATGNFYYDIATGHKYIKNPGTNTYREFSQKGKLLRDALPSSLSLLASNKYIREVKHDCYLLYQKINYQKEEFMVLSPDQKHPNGWILKKLLVAMN